MAFVVINRVATSAADLPRILAEVHALGIDVLRSQQGFKSARLITAEDETEVALTIEWESRDHFVAYRQSPAGQNLITRAADLHPHIAFYDVAVALDRPGQ
jgi:heme-degrading monooxygenase HmoA